MFKNQEECIDYIRLIELEISLWESVEVYLEADGTKKVKNAMYKDDPLFPLLITKVYDEKEGCDKEFVIYCYALYDDMTRSDWEKEYENTGETPAYTFPDGTKQAISCHIINLQADLTEARENLKVLEKCDLIPKNPEQIVKDLIFYWKDKYAEEYEEWKKAPKWYAKHVSISISFGENNKELTAKELGFDDAFVEYIGGDICDDLRKHGAVVHLSGMMD